MRDSITLLEDDTRAVASLLGFVLLFGIAVIGFSMYQAYAVPDQNAQTEFQHFEEAKDQMVAFRSAAIDTASDDIPRSVTFDLGTRFQQRYLAVNPPPPTGTLATSDQYEVTINPDSDDISVPARFLEFNPNYREFHPGVLRYEHGIVYLDAREANGGVVVLAGELPESRLHLAPIQNEFSQTGQQRVSLEISRPNNSEQLPTIEEVEIPTRLNESQWEDKIGIPVDDLRGDNPTYITVDGSDISDITPVGIQEQPERANSTVELGSNGDDGGTCTIGSNNNPGRLQWNNLQGFKAQQGANVWKIEQINVQSQAGNNLNVLKLRIEDSSGTVRATRTIDISTSTRQYQDQDIEINPDDQGYEIPKGDQAETYTLIATICDVNGNSNTETRQATS